MILMYLIFVRIGQETLTDDNFAEDDIEIELAPIAVQLAYVQQVNKSDENILPSLFLIIFLLYFIKRGYTAANNSNLLVLSAPWKHTRSIWSLYRYHQTKSGG